MKHLILGDVHGYHHNLRKLLLQNEVIDKRGYAINRDEFKVYCTGDLIDGNYNRQGDILNLEFADEWFDAICIGNHEYAFLGGKEFGSRRKHDERTTNLLLELIDKNLYVPSLVVYNHLLVHGGFSSRFDFDTAEDANEYIQILWRKAPELETEIPVFDWTGGARQSYGYAYGDPTGGIFELDWVEERNKKFPQVVGHSTYYTGPVTREYDNGVTHWNIDTGGKTGKGLGGIILDDVEGSIEVSLWGDRPYNDNKPKKMFPPVGDKMYAPPPEKENKSTTPLSEPLWRDIPLVDDLDIDIALISDPDILEVYMEEISRDGDMRLKDFVNRKMVIH